MAYGHCKARFPVNCFPHQTELLSLSLLMLCAPRNQNKQENNFISARLAHFRSSYIHSFFFLCSTIKEPCKVERRHENKAKKRFNAIFSASFLLLETLYGSANWFMNMMWFPSIATVRQLLTGLFWRKYSLCFLYRLVWEILIMLILIGKGRSFGRRVNTFETT